MGKLLGLFFGFLIFGPIGSLIGLIFGVVFDSNVKIFDFGVFNGEEYYENSIVIEAFPLICAEIVLAKGADKNGVYIVKEFAVEIFGKKTAKSIMEEFKNYVEMGYSDYKLQSFCNNIKYGLDSNSKISFINLIYKIIKARGYYSSEEIEKLKYIANLVGINIDPFGSSGRNDNFYGYYEKYGSYGYGDEEKVSYSTGKDYYKILETDQDASDEEIKKSYRSLCKKYHPDIVNNLPEREKKASEEKMKEIIDAYEEIKKERGIK